MARSFSLLLCLTVGGCEGQLLRLHLTSQQGQCADGWPTLAAGAEMSQTELVAMLRSRARKSGTQTSHFRGVSLLKQTGKWHAQINVGGKQVGACHPALLLSGHVGPMWLDTALVPLGTCKVRVGTPRAGAPGVLRDGRGGGACV